MRIQWRFKAQLSQLNGRERVFDPKDHCVRIPYRLAFVHPSTSKRCGPMCLIYDLISHVPQSL
ncbi:hypothetical protein COCCADRAFT_102535 [Bipolaris zeicola 26-R-13]|uniref:Uncharacterized protein n=1 Tax=Cochliobolus carbonum (strain 26-R-13) TaxID=930089 RepID=W6XTL6_COCC2|nr:uncharacterized protein COCCADRAFT_102535 [Bipolaris zeicola 26-R-13]EUC30957.1 hypothetical protein COCCADRAFT_102535 [Bipolaris zeicola 26-R-13]